jgi:hypothetical protein
VSRSAHFNYLFSFPCEFNLRSPAILLTYRM